MHNRRIGITELTRILVPYGYLPGETPSRVDAETYRHIFFNPVTSASVMIDLDYGVYCSPWDACATRLVYGLVTFDGDGVLHHDYTDELGLGHTDIRTIIHNHFTAKETTA